MKQFRLDQLADSIFAIVMTILVFEIRVPEISGTMSNGMLINSIINMYPLFLSYLLSFSLIFTYWRSHHFIASVLARNIDTKFANLNGIFFFLVGLVPFSSHLLGTYFSLQISTIFFAINIILIGLSLFAMRSYAVLSQSIENAPFTKTENDHAWMHIFFPIMSAILAIIVSFYSVKLALLIFTIAILFNLSNKGTSYVYFFINFFRAK